MTLRQTEDFKTDRAKGHGRIRAVDFHQGLESLDVIVTVLGIVLENMYLKAHADGS